MGLLEFLRGPDMDAGVAQCRQTPGAVLLDVRTPEEYRGGHIPGSRNLPLDALQGVTDAVPDKGTPLFVYCRSGARSGQAVRLLGQMGYTRVTNIGGIMQYQGKVER